MALPRGAWRAASLLLLVLAVALAWMAFTRFDATSLSTSSPEDQLEFEHEQMRDARLSATLGVAASFALLGTFACWQRGGRAGTADAVDDPPAGPPQP